ncbi:MAG: chorismate-binding protein [Nitrospirae bacterium]|nr:chorismate-binding protein [Nitrospirota bacterium]
MGTVFQPLVRSIPYESPLITFKKIYQSPPAFLLESSRESGATGRYSFIGTDPYMTFLFDGTQGVITRKGKPPEGTGSDPFHTLQELLAGFQLDRAPDLPPFFGGAAGFFGYDVVRYFEKLPGRKKKTETFPEIYLFFIDTVIAFDHLERRAEIIYHPSPEDLNGIDWETLKSRGEIKIAAYLDILNGPFPAPSPSSSASRDRNLVFESSLSRNEFENIVLQCQEYIRCGDIFQANLSLRFSFDRPGVHPLVLYERLQKINPSPFSSFLDGGSFQIVSSSPERLVSLSHGILSTRPIAGTRPRGTSETEQIQMQSGRIHENRKLFSCHSYRFQYYWEHQARSGLARYIESALSGRDDFGSSENQGDGNY